METQRLRVIRATGEEGSVEVSIESIHLGGLGVTRVFLDSLDEMKNLKTLWLYRNNLREIDLRPLTAASHLRSVSLSSNELCDIDLSPLATCHLLTEIDLSGNRLSDVDLQPLGGLHSLEILNLGTNPLHDIDLSPLEGCNSLRVLDLSGPSGTERTSVSDGQHSDPQHGRRLDITSLFLCRSLDTARVSSDTELSADPSLRYVASCRRSKIGTVIKSAPEDVVMPRMQWLTPSIAARIVWPQYEAFFTTRSPREVLSRLIRILSRVSGVYSFHLQKGLMEGFGMEWLSGVDCDPKDLVERLSSDEHYEAARNKIRTRALQLLKDQVSRGGSTLFVGVDKLVEHNQSALAALVAERRADEMRDAVVVDHDDYVDVLDLKLTAYGLSMMDAMHIDSSSIPPHQFERLSRELELAGFTIRIEKTNHTGHAPTGRTSRSRSLLRFVLQDRVLH